MGGGQDREKPQPLHICKVEQPWATINRLHILIHLLGTVALLYYRASTPPPLQSSNSSSSSSWCSFETLTWALLFASELLFSFLWIINQAYRWRPISRTVFPERLPEDEQLPPIDIFICTADPEKEPTMEVMNTLVSAMCLDYPTDKLHVYLSDDGGSKLTLHSTRQAYSFARSWLPFCKKNKIDTRCPEAYFASSEGDHDSGRSDAFGEEHERMKLMYEAFKERLTAIGMSELTKGFTIKGEDRLPFVEVIHDELGTNTCYDEQSKMPLLVYISREKRKTHPHHFKAGALNVLLRVSSIMSNSPYILVLDCDMYCNSPISARQAMCFHLDPHLSRSLAFVQFPQAFHNISKNDIYCAELRSLFKIMWKGCDGFKGPILSGTGFYIKRDALYGAKPGQILRDEFDSIDFSEVKRCFGTSNEFIASLRQSYKNNLDNKIMTSTTQQQEATLVASCTYEINTQWGERVGFLYGSVVEDYFTGFHLHCRGWISTYCYPSRPAFLGSVPINFHDTLVQHERWASGLLEVGFSRFCPLIYGMTTKNSVLQSMCYAWLAFQPLYSFSILCYGLIPQLCFLNGISVYPPVSSPWFALFGIVYTSSLCQHLREVFHNGGSVNMWWNEQRFGMITSITSHIFACLNIIMKLIGIKEVHFHLTNKVSGEEQTRRYEKGIFDFEGSSLVLVPLTTLTILNLATLIIGGARMIARGNVHEMFGQLFLSLFILVMSYSVIEGIIIRKDNGRVPTFITLLSVMLTTILLVLFH